MNQIKYVFLEVKKESPILYWIVILHLFAAVICIPAIWIDERTLQGISVWIKPFKFLLSGAIYIFTVGFFLTLYPYSNRKKNRLRNIVSWSTLLEIVIIVFQGARGVKSHFNLNTALDGLLYGVMGIMVTINALLMVLFLFDAIRLKLKVNKAVQSAIILGWLIVILGSWVGGQMLSQLSHTVGAADGGAGLPLVNWSTIAGDLRIAHFFGLHGLQIIPVFAYFISEKWNTKVSNKTLLVLAFGLLYAAWIGFTYFQAKQGIALLQL